MSNIKPSNQHTAASKDAPRYADKNGLMLPDNLRFNMVPVPEGGLPKLLQYGVEYNLVKGRYEFAKRFATFLYHKDLDVFRPVEELTDTFSVGPESPRLLNMLRAVKFGHKSHTAIINVETLQMQDGEGNMMDNSDWQQALGSRLAKLVKSLDDKRQSKKQQVHIVTRRAGV